MKILVIHCGGTISCISENGFLTPKGDIEEHFRALSAVFGEISFLHRHTAPFLSEHLTLDRMVGIALEVKKGISDGFDGIIVTHGSDTLAYTSAFLSYIFGSACTPVITVCADLPLSEPSSSGHAALRGACSAFLSGELRGVYACCGLPDGTAELHRASRILRYRTYEVPLSSTPCAYAKIYFSSDGSARFVPSSDYAELDDAPELDFFFNPEKLKCAPAESPVFYLSIAPAMLYPLPPAGTKAVILGSYHSGTLDTQSPSLCSFCEHCSEHGITVFVDGIGANADYQSMALFDELGILRLPRLVSPIAMYIKIWLISLFTDKLDSALINLSRGGDIVPTNSK